MKVLVTGGGGFLGRRICHFLQERNYQVSIYNRTYHDDLAKNGIKCIVGDITNFDDVNKACKGQDAVLHVASIAGVWGKYQDYYNINVLGTKNIIKACLKQGVTKLVYTSTPSVVFDRKDILKGDEHLPYTLQPLNHYQKTKIMAEKEVLMQNQDDILSCALRPHLIWGPRDTNLLPRLFAKAKKNLLRQIGNGENLVDTTYVDNAAHAHILALENLKEKSSLCQEAYFIGDGKEVNLWDFLNELLQQVKLNPIEKKISFNTAYTVGSIIECIYKIFAIKKEPNLTRFLAYQLGYSHYFSHQKAYKDFGYEPIVSKEEGLRQVKLYYG